MILSRFWIAALTLMSRAAFAQGTLDYLSAFSPPPTVPGIRANGMIRDRIRQALQDSVFLLSPQARAPLPTVAPAAVVDLAALLNRHWRSDIVFTMDGARTYISGSFNRRRSAFLTAYQDGWDAPKIFNIADLSEKPGRLKFGPSPFRGAAYSVTLRVAIFNPPASRFVFKREPDGSEEHSAGFQQLFDSFYAQGVPLKLSGQDYQVFYGNEVSEGPGVEEGLRTLGFLHRQGNKVEATLVGAEDLGAGRLSVFKLHDGKAVGLSLSGSTLRVYDVP